MWKIERKVSKGDYDYAVVIGHPNATKRNYVLYHRVVMENHIGRILTSEEVVHHIDGNKKNNTIENLELMNETDHARHHHRSGRLMVELQCPNCGSIFHREKRKTTGKTTICCSRSCNGTFWRNIQLYGETPQTKQSIKRNIRKEYKAVVV